MFLFGLFLCVGPLVHQLLVLFSLVSGVSPAVHKWRQVQRQGQVSVPSQLYWKVLPDARSERTPAAPADVRGLQPNSDSLHTYTASDLQQRPESW